jgi:hypothetical protein
MHVPVVSYIVENHSIPILLLGLWVSLLMLRSLIKIVKVLIAFCLMRLEGIISARGLESFLIWSLVEWLGQVGVCAQSILMLCFDSLLPLPLNLATKFASSSNLSLGLDIILSVDHLGILVFLQE